MQSDAWQLPCDREKAPVISKSATGPGREINKRYQSPLPSSRGLAHETKSRLFSSIHRTFSRKGAELKQQELMAYG
jgi:hypothetical protein